MAENQVEDVLKKKMNGRLNNGGSEALKDAMKQTRDKAKPETMYKVDEHEKEKTDVENTEKLKKTKSNKATALKKGIVNQKINIKISEDIKSDLEIFKTMNRIKFDYEAIARLLDNWAINIDSDERMLYDSLRKKSRKKAEND